ncbi:MAG: PLP-dependent aminotransferase family protein [Bacteroidetes bacterium]|nr:PLP-dependent aminotransferase family protein [Bacteroidota bacterium]
MTEPSELLFLRIARQLERQISDEVLHVGERLPSVRMLSRQQGISVSTALQAYAHLESKGLIMARPQSGYYVRFSPGMAPERPALSKPATSPINRNVDALIFEVFSNLTDPRITRFSLSVPAPELLPVARLKKAMMQALNDTPGNGTCYEEVVGNLELRRQIARWAMHWNGKLSEEDLITTSGAMNAIAYGLMALTKPGDLVAVESPCYFGTLRLLHSLGLKVLELPTHPDEGISIPDLKKALDIHPVKLCLFVTNFGNPLGHCMSDEAKRELVQLLAERNLPLIEDDLYGDVWFGKRRPMSCKSFDEAGLVLWCGSISKTLAPGFRVGWIAPGKFFDSVKRLKMYHSITSASPEQAAIGSFLATGNYDRHLRGLREVLQANCLQYIRCIREYFPEGTRVTHPQGGFILWVELDQRLDTHLLYQAAIRQRISIAPGAMFSMQPRYQNCMRLSYGMPWTPALEKALQKLGTLAKAMLLSQTVE